jgi:sulfide:quinone oxidoreductase
MQNIVVLGGGVAGHTAALHLKRLLGNKHSVTVVTPNSQWNWIPSNIWVGVGKMPATKVVFPLAPVYRRKHITYHQAAATAIHPNGDANDAQSFVEVISTKTGSEGNVSRVAYDYLINATGPKLRFDLTPGLGPDGFTDSVCTYSHANVASQHLQMSIDKMKQGTPQILIVGMGHGTCTCEGAAFEYVFNVDHVLRENGVRHLAHLIYLTNEHELGDFGVGGMTFAEKNGAMSSETWMTSLFLEKEIDFILGAHVTQVREGEVDFVLIDGTQRTQAFDFAMLLPPFRGVGMHAFDRSGADITDTLFAASGFFKVDANYAPKPFEEWTARDWPKTYESPTHPNHFGVGIAFAPPHGISRPYQTPDGVVIAPAPPRTGMPSGVQGKTVAQTIAHRIKSGDSMASAKTASMASMGAACIASIGADLRNGAAATITMSPIVPDTVKYPGTGRDASETFGEVGLAGHWMKRLLHTLFIYKAKARFGWALIPE